MESGDRERAPLEGLAQRVAVRAAWERLVVPAKTEAQLREIAASVRARPDRQNGITVQFSGPPGTGKTLAASVLATELGLELYKVDLAAVVSKYIGETEKNLGRIFDAAEAGGVILLFDEADALFGRRTEVRDSHDRFANIEVGYLLQRIESYPGLTILATNLKRNIDPAFTRRLRHVVEFPMPGRPERERLWRMVLPDSVPGTSGLDVARLARFRLTGGAIRNAAVRAALLAASEGGQVATSHALHSIRSERRRGAS